MKAFTRTSNRRNAVTLEKKRRKRFASIQNKSWGEINLPYPFEDALYDSYVPRVIFVPSRCMLEAKAERRPSKKADFNVDQQVVFKSKERRRSFVKINDIRRSFRGDAEIGEKVDDAVRDRDKLGLRGSF